MKSITFMETLDDYTGTIFDITRNWQVPSDVLKKMQSKTTDYLRHIGVGALDRVALVLESQVAFMVNFFSLVEIGAVPVLLSKLTTVNEIENYDTKFGLHWVIADRDIKHAFSVNDYFWEVRKLNQNASHLQQLKGMILQPTSGSTGVSNMCIRDELGCLAEPQNHIETVGLDKGGTVLCPVSLVHAYGFGTAFLVSFLTSSDFILLDEMNPRKIIDVFSRYNVTMFTGVPAVYDMLATMRISKKITMSTNLLSAGAPLLRHTSEVFYSRLHSFIHPSYGSTETGEMCLETEDVITETGCVGKPLRYTSLDFEQCDNGLMQIRSKNPSMMKGYLKEHGIIDTSIIAEDGSFCTGDLGEQNDDGRVTLRGRNKFIINVFGIKVNPLEVEEIMRQLDEVKDVYVYAGRHRTGSESVLAVVKTTGSVTEQALIDKCKKLMSRSKVPSRIFIMDQVPRNQSGKIIKELLPQTV